jgi:hypothetical protein
MEPGVMTDRLEAPQSDFLPTFVIPESDREALVDDWLSTQRNQSDYAKERQRLEAKAERLKVLCPTPTIEKIGLRSMRNCPLMTTWRQNGQETASRA